MRISAQMMIKQKVSELLSLVMLLAIAFAAFNCDEKPTNSNGNDENEIIWQQTALDSLTITSLATNTSGDIFAGACGYGIYRTIDWGTTWASVYENGCPVAIATRADGDVFAVLSQIALLRSADRGKSWTRTLVTGFGVYLAPIASNISGEIFVGSAKTDESTGGIYRSDDNGETWAQTSFPDSISAGVLAINSNGDIFAGTGFGVFRSTDNGKTWPQVNDGFADLGFPPVILSVAVDPVRGAIYTGVEYDGVYRSMDNGDTWERTGLTSPTVISIIVSPEGYIFAGSSGYSTYLEPEGVFYSKDNGESWTQMNSGLTNPSIWILAVDSSGFVYAGTDGDGVFRTVKSTTERN